MAEEARSGASRVRVLGSGNAFNEDGRGSAAFVVEIAGGPRVMIDVGPTAMASAELHGVDLASLEALFVTHLHGDHVAGWPFLLLRQAMIERRDRPFDVIGPVGTEACFTTLFTTCYGELTDAVSFEVRYRELPVADADGLSGPGGLGFDVVRMQHHPTSLGYRLHAPDARLAFTGDTVWCDGLERLARGTDALFVECTTLVPGPGAHLSLEELRGALDRLEAAQRVLIHVNDAVATDVARDPLPGVLVAYDGWTFTPVPRDG